MQIFHKILIYKKYLKGDFYGGVSAAILSIPSALAYGVLAFAPLGEKYIALGAVAGLLCVVFNGTVSSLFGGTPTMISGPKGSITLILSSILTRLLIGMKADLNDPVAISLIITILFFSIFLSGLFQVIFGMMKIGNFIKFIPYPTIAGFINGTAILIITNQLSIFFGVKGHDFFSTVFQDPSQIQILTFIVGLVTVYFILFPNRITKNLPSPVVGLFMGALTYYIFIFLGFEKELGPVMGAVGIEFPTPKYIPEFISLFTSVEVLKTILSIFPAIVVLTLLTSIDTLVNSLAVESFTHQKSDCNKELIGQGLGNLISACFGGLSGAGTASRALANYKSGGRTELSGGISGIFVLISVLFFATEMKYIPKVVLAGILIAIGIQMFDRWSLRILKKIIQRKVHNWTETATNVLVIFVVSATSVIVDMVFSVFLGLGLTILLLAMKTSQSGIRKKYYGGKIFSKKQRDSRFMEILYDEGRKIVVFELEGYLYFGSSERLADEIDKLDDQIRFVIIDLKRVVEIDITGAKVLEKIFKSLQKIDVHLFVTNLDTHGKIWYFLQDTGILNSIGQKHFFPDTDIALEYAEDYLINYNFVRRMSPDSTMKEEDRASNLIDLFDMNYKEIPLEKTDIFQGFTKEDLSILRPYLEERVFNIGETIFRQGDPGDEMFIITEGTATVSINLSENKYKRLIVFSPGTVFGEMALIDKKPRSANLEANDHLVCYSLSYNSFLELRKMHPEIIIKLLENISKEITSRLRMSHSIISELEN
ncbi:MAG: SLC26A/SulP transporter family protein [Leptospiraceae bacterium]|nr:SLC26A/SulP transporter family protein [Leptospiraceae bacterium]MCK6379686.1 SLC26A/SulP transporter family protein [Leptospiraceae bacterium]NUM41577.1 SLC26A/SulP transporter family protein [Leptospiraceae bacterium]